MQIKLSGVPLLISEPPPLTSDITTEDFMSDTVCAIPHILMVGKLVDILNTTKHNGFPVVASKVCFCRVSLSVKDLSSSILVNNVVLNIITYRQRQKSINATGYLKDLFSGLS